jgi:hypothetical protein
METAYDVLASRIETKDLIDPNNIRQYYYIDELPLFVVCVGW